MTGDYDWICHFVFDSVEQYEFESSNFLNRFVDLIDDFRSYESSMVKVTPYTLYDDYEIRDQKWRAYKILNSLKKYQNLNEKLQSFAGYPLTIKGNVIGVLAMFSTRRMQAADFEILGIFSDQISKELGGLFSAVDFLIPGGDE